MDETVLLGHGSGGSMMQRINDRVFLEAYGSDELRQGNDAADLPGTAPGRLPFLVSASHPADGLGCGRTPYIQTDQICTIGHHRLDIGFRISVFQGFKTLGYQNQGDVPTSSSEQYS